jgi:hypothetical protein
MYVPSPSWGRNPDFRRCRNVVVLLSGVKRVTYCLFLFTAFYIGSSFTLSSPNQGQMIINTKYVTEIITYQYCDNVLPNFFLTIMSVVLRKIC